MSENKILDEKKPKERSRTISTRDRQNIQWFWQRYLKEKTPRLLLIFILAVSQGVVYQQFLSLTDKGLRVIFTDGNLKDLFWVCCMVFLVFSYRGIMSFVVPRLSALVSTSAIMKMRNDLISHVLTLDLKFFDRTPVGDFILKIVQQPSLFSTFVGQTTVRAIRDIATLIIVSVYLFIKQPLLFSSALIVFPLLILIMQKISKRGKIHQQEFQDANASLIDRIEEIIGGIRTIKISNQTDAELARLETATHDIKTSHAKLLTAQAAAQPFVDFAAAFVYMLVIGVGGYIVLSPAYDVDGAEIITFLLGLVLVFDPGRRIAQFWVSMLSSLVVLDSIRKLHDEKPSITNKDGATREFDAKADITLSNVAFSYADDSPLFDDVSMTFDGGKTTAIVGTTGSGKSTVLSLITRLYEPTSGTITVGDTDVRDIEMSALRSAFSVVAQDIVIFNASIAENIRYVKPDATDADLKTAAKSAEIWDLMQDRGDAPVGPKGAQLSGGQRQRIAIARAFLRSAPIILLDEATSALDQQTEDKVKTALNRLSEGRTTLVVAHRLSSIMDADKIIVLEAGKIVEQGTHKRLLRNKALYYSLFNAQKRA